MVFLPDTMQLPNLPDTLLWTEGEGLPLWCPRADLAVPFYTSEKRALRERNLRAEALVAQSADIHTVSGATLTSNAYRSSLQAALDAAGGHWGCPQPRRSP